MFIIASFPARIRDVASINTNFEVSSFCFFVISGDIICQLLLDVSSEENSRKWICRAYLNLSAGIGCCNAKPFTKIIVIS